MGLYDLKYSKATGMYTPANEQEAWIAVLHACMAVDEDVADEELDKLADMLTFKPFFKGHDVREYYKSVLLAQAELGSKHLIDNSVDQIPPEHKNDLFAQTIEMVLADGVIAEKEKELVSYITSALDLDLEVCQHIIQSKLQRNKEKLKQKNTN
ncbi:tellurite resistance TerB family protein [Pontibacter sp. CAU 1760]